VFDEAGAVSNFSSYCLSGADRFQLFFDSVARKKTGTGNVIRAAVIVSGIIPEYDLRQSIIQNEAIRLMCSLSLKQKWYSALYRLENDKHNADPGSMIFFHQDENREDAYIHALSRDCSFYSGSPICIDVIYSGQQTHVIFSINHVLMDHAGMENLLVSFSESRIMQLLPRKKRQGKFILNKIADAIGATLFVAALSGWNMRRLPVISGKRIPDYEKLELTEEETRRANLKLTNEIQTSKLAFFLGCAMHALDASEELLVGNPEKYFVAVPINRRSASDKETVFSNFLSFIYFQAKAGEMKSIKNISQRISQQMILQARKKLPGKFSSLLDLFRFVPATLYRAFINLPGNGDSGTFAFSLLSNSLLENKLFLGFPVTDVSHYAPVISPPALNIVFNEFNGRLKIILSFDESRINKMKARELLLTIRKNLLN